MRIRRNPCLRMISVWLSFLLSFSLSFDFTARSRIQTSFLAPTSVAHPIYPAKKPLTDLQIQVIKQVFLNSDLRDMLNRVIGQLLVNLSGQYENDIIALSDIAFNRDLVVEKEPDEAEKGTSKKRKRSRRARKKDLRTFQQWFNDAVTEQLLREVRIQEITYRHKKRTENHLPAEIERDLKEIRQVLPEKGIRVFMVKGAYALLFNDLVFILHERPLSTIHEFDRVLNESRFIFQERPENNRGSFLLSAYQVPQQEIENLEAIWSKAGLAEEPTEEMVETLSVLERFIPYIYPTLDIASDDIAYLKDWLYDDDPDEEAELGVKFYNIGSRIRDWDLALTELEKNIEAFKTLPKNTTSDVMLKIASGRDLLDQIREIAEDVLSEIINKQGLLYPSDKTKNELLKFFDKDRILEDSGIGLQYEDLEEGDEETDTVDEVEGPIIEEEFPEMKAGEDPDKTAENTLNEMISSLDDDMTNLLRKLSRLNKFSEVIEVDVSDSVQRIVNMNNWQASLKNITLKSHIPAKKEEFKIVAYPLDLEMELDQLVKSFIDMVMGMRKEEEEPEEIEISIEATRLKGGKGKILLHVRAYRKGKETPFKVKEHVIETHPSNQSKINRIHQFRSEVRPAQIRTVSTRRFRKALSRYLNQFNVEETFVLLSAPLKSEIIHLNDISGYSLRNIIDLKGGSFNNYKRKILEAAGLTQRQSEVLFTQRTKLRDLADLTGLRLSELARILGLPHRSNISLGTVRRWTLNTHDKSGKLKKTPRQYLDRMKARRNVQNSTLVFMRLITQDPAGNIVEQLVMDRYDRLVRYADMLGSPSSFNKFLFNARRTFDLDSREIVFNELYIDPQARGFGSLFHKEQINRFIESGFDGVRVREDAISVVTLKWFEDYKIDWDRLAFKDRWLKTMRSLFRDLGIPVPQQNPTSEQLKNALKQAKARSSGFRKMLELKHGGGEVAKELIEIILNSDENGFLEFLRFRMIGYGRRQVRLNKLRQGFDLLPDSYQEKRDGLEIINEIEMEESDYWKMIRAAELKLEEGLASIDGNDFDYKPDFSKGAEDRIEAFKITESLLHRYEFGLSLLGVLSAARLQLLEKADETQTQKKRRRIRQFDDHELLDSMRPFFLQTGETVAPHFIEEFQLWDREISRYNHFWHPEWDKPSRFLLKNAQEFHDLIQRTELHSLKRAGSRIYSPDIAKMFFNFPTVRKMLSEQDGAVGVGKFMIALFYFNPQLLGIILRSSHDYLPEARQALSSLPDSMIAKILDLEVTPVPPDSQNKEPFLLYDNYQVLSLLEPNEVYHTSYSKRVKRLIKHMRPRTLAILLQQSYNMYSFDLVEGWYKSVFLAALKGKETARDPHFIDSKTYLKDPQGLNDFPAWNWVNDFFKRKTQKYQRWDAGHFVDFARSRLENDNSTSLLGKTYNPIDIYGPFMRHFGGFVDPDEETTDSADALRRDAAHILSKIYQVKDIGPKIVGTIIRSTPNAQDRQTYEILARLAKIDVKTLIGLLNDDLYFVPKEDIESFRKVNRFVFLIFFRNMLLNSLQDNSIITEEIVRAILNGLEPESIAALIQIMWLNADNNRFSRIEDDLSRMMSLIDGERHESILNAIKLYDENNGTSVKRWVLRAMGQEGYSDNFYSDLGRGNVWLIQNDLFSSMLSEKLERFWGLMEQSKNPEIRDVMRVIEVPMTKLIRGVRDQKYIAEAVLEYGKVKMELNRLQSRLMRDFAEEELTEELQVPFYFHFIENALDSFFQLYVKEQGLTGFTGMNNSSSVLKVRVLPDIPENREHFRNLKLGDLLITNGLPENDPNIKKPGGILQGIPVSTNSHAYELAKEMAIPFGFLHSAEQTLRFLDGEIVVFEVEGRNARLRLATPEEVSAFHSDPTKNKALSALSKLEIPGVSLGKDESWVISLNELSPEDRTRVGFKAVRLGRLSQTGDFMVPAGFSITYEGYEAFLRHNGMLKTMEELTENIDRVDDNEINKRLAQIRKLFSFGSFPPAMIEHIERELEKLGDVPLFVRSSSNVEDLPGYSGAGRLDSYGPVDNNRTIILSKIREVMLSLWKEKAFNNRKAHGIKGTEHLRAKVSVLIQLAVDARYSGLFSTQYENEPGRILVTIDEKVKGGVEDRIEGRTAPTLVYDKKSGTLERRFEGHPLFWEDSSIGLAQLLQKIKKNFPMVNSNLQKEILLAVTKKPEEELAEYLRSLNEELKQPEWDIETLVSKLKTQLNTINQQQIDSIFGPLLEEGEKIEKFFKLSPILVEFAIDKNGSVIPLQVKGHEGARKISFKVQVLNQYGMHVRPGTLLFQQIRKHKLGNLFETNQIFIKREGEQGDGTQFRMPMDFLLLGGEKGEIFEITISGKNVFELGRLIRHLFLNLLADYDDESEMRSPKHQFISWERIQELMGSYFQEDDSESGIPWNDHQILWNIYQMVFGHLLEPDPEQVETAI